MRLALVLLSTVFMLVGSAGVHAEAEEVSAVPHCSAKGFTGSTIEGAISACMASGLKAYLCGRGVTCTPGMPMCTVQGFAGTTIESAIYICREAGLKAYICSRNVVCN